MNCDFKHLSISTHREKEVFTRVPSIQLELDDRTNITKTFISIIEQIANTKALPISSPQHIRKRCRIDIILAKITKTPVILGRFRQTVVAELGRICRTHKAAWDGAAQQDGHDSVLK